MSPPAATATAPSALVLEIPIARIQPDTNNVRGAVGDVTELAKSIKAQGVLQAILVAEGPTLRGKPTYILIAGHRRWTAAKKAGLTTIPAMVRAGLDEIGRLEAQLTENLQRRDLTATQEARGYARLVALGASQRQIITTMGCSQSHVSKRLALLGLPDVDQQALDDGEFTIAEGLSLAKLVDHPKHYKRARSAVGVPDVFRGAVKAALDEIENAPKIAAAEAEIRKLGYQVKPWPKSGSGWWNAPFAPHAGTEPIDNLPDYYVSKIEITDCTHIAATIAHDGTVVTVCTNPKAHEPKPKKPAGPKLTAAERAEQEAAKTAEAERRAMLDELGPAAGKERAGAISDMVASFSNGALHDTLHALVSRLDGPALAVVELLASIVALDQGYIDRDALRLLGVEPVKGTYEWELDWEAGIFRWAGQNPAERLERLLAAAVSIVATSIDDELEDLAGHAATSLYRALAAHGHQPTDIERDYLRVLGRLDVLPEPAPTS